MSGAADQINASLSITTPLGPDVLHPIGLEAQEAISAPFIFTVRLVSERSAIDADSLLYLPVCITLHRPPASDRHFHGIVRHLAAIGLPARGHWSYVAEIVPRMWFMGQTADCRIFQGKSIKDILAVLFTENGVNDVAWKLYGDKPVREYVTQFNETDLNFATRLMEEAGYFYFFEHTATTHTLVVTDRNQAFAPLDQPTHHVVHAGRNAEVLDGWHKLNTTAHGKITLLDYDPEKPSTLPRGQDSTALKTSGAGLRDVFNWPARTSKTEEAGGMARLRMEAAEAAAGLFQGTGFDQAFVPGGKFTISRDPFDGARDVEYFIQAVAHRAQDESWLTGGAEPSYSNSFTAAPSRVTWRQPLATPRPVMAGIHAAIVLGNSGEEIHSERLARVKIRFFWDHRSDAVADQACWVRVLQPWSGNSWGWQHLPRVGTEVAVGFMDGDPDNPVVVGCLYNGDMQPVFAVPGEQTKSGMRTRSSTQGGTSDFSEFSFDDKKGNELVFLHAQKDLTTEVENDQSLKVDHCRTVTVQQDETVAIGNNQSIKVQANRTVEVTQGDDTLAVKAGNLKHTTLQDYAVKSDTGNVTVEALQSIVLKVGENSLKIDQMGVTINGMIVKVQGQMSLQLQGLMSQLGGDAMLTLKGGIMMLN
ncbi:MAG: type VI secretion system tip protein VgrG [Acetobacteraceae bacterium]|nr:type VI secretion system tip protein VgrG [Acetobacteraceae bacterium]